MSKKWGMPSPAFLPHYTPDRHGRVAGEGRRVVAPPCPCSVDDQVGDATCGQEVGWVIRWCGAEEPCLPVWRRQVEPHHRTAKITTAAAAAARDDGGDDDDDDDDDDSHRCNKRLRRFNHKFLMKAFVILDNVYQFYKRRMKCRKSFDE